MISPECVPISIRGSTQNLSGWVDGKGEAENLRGLLRARGTAPACKPGRTFQETPMPQSV